MATHRNPNGSQTLLNAILDFGPDDNTAESPDLSERIRKVKEKIEEINERIARLTSESE